MATPDHFHHQLQELCQQPWVSLAIAASDGWDVLHRRLPCSPGHQQRPAPGCPAAQRVDETNRRHDPERDDEGQAGDQRVILHEEELWPSC